MGATALHLFGFTARDAAGSDIDLFIDFDPRSSFSLLGLIGIKHYLEDELGLVVDVAIRGGLHPLLRERIEQDAIRVF